MYVYFFGCVGNVGHYLHDVQLRVLRRSPMPWTFDALEADSVWTRDHRQTEGAAVLSERDGWTCLAWPDRSIDSRRGSHANVVAKGAYTAEQMIAIARVAFPTVLARMKYRIALPRRARRMVSDGRTRR